MTPEHIEEQSDGAKRCMHCGGDVDDEGYSMALGGEVQDAGGEGAGHVATNDDGDADKLKESAFSTALLRRKGE
jgi:hypothetical protein